MLDPPAETLVVETEINEVVAVERRAAAVGIETMMLPAPLADTPLRNANASWISLYAEFVKRFHPYHEDMEVLREELGFKSKLNIKPYSASFLFLFLLAIVLHYHLVMD